MIDATVKGNAIEIGVSRAEALLATVSVLLLAGLSAIAGWKVALLSAGLAFIGTGVVDLVHRAEILMPWRVTR